MLVKKRNKGHQGPRGSKVVRGVDTSYEHDGLRNLGPDHLLGPGPGDAPYRAKHNIEVGKNCDYLSLATKEPKCGYL